MNVSLVQPGSSEPARRAAPGMPNSWRSLCCFFWQVPQRQHPQLHHELEGRDGFQCANTQAQVRVGKCLYAFWKLGLLQVLLLPCSLILKCVERKKLKNCWEFYSNLLCFRALLLLRSLRAHLGNSFSHHTSKQVVFRLQRIKYTQLFWFVTDQAGRRVFVP